MKAKDLREKTLAELQEELGNMRLTQFNLRAKQATGQLEHGHPIRAIRRDIARVKMVISEKMFHADKAV